MSTATYPPPVNQLLTYGDPRAQGLDTWPNYLELGLGPGHIPDLIRMATDKTLNWADPESLEVWAPLHAWRALGQLRAEAAIEPLLGLLDELEDNEWFNEELPDVMAMIGPVGIPALTTYLADDTHKLFARVTASMCLEHIGSAHPDARNACVAAIAHQLDAHADNDDTLNAFLISDLIDLKAVEAAPLMERAFAADDVDPSITGDWEEVQIALGLRTTRETERPHFPLLGLARRGSDAVDPALAGPLSVESPSPSGPVSPAGGGHKRHATEKAKRKMADKSRKRNRKRK